MLIDYLFGFVLGSLDCTRETAHIFSSVPVVYPHATERAWRWSVRHDLDATVRNTRSLRLTIPLQKGEVSKMSPRWDSG